MFTFCCSLTTWAKTELTNAQINFYFLLCRFIAILVFCVCYPWLETMFLFFLCGLLAWKLQFATCSRSHLSVACLDIDRLFIVFAAFLISKFCTKLREWWYMILTPSSSGTCYDNVIVQSIYKFVLIPLIHNKCPSTLIMDRREQLKLQW